MKYLDEFRDPDAARSLIDRIRRTADRLPGEVEVVINYAGCLQVLGRSEEARTILTAALALQPDNPRLLNQRGNVRLEEKI